MFGDASHAISPETNFWQWFEANSDRLMDFESDQEQIFDELDAELAKVAEGLTFEFSSQAADEREFIVSADGIAALFPAVISLIGVAPTLPGWRFIAFRQPKGTHFTIGFGEHELSPDDMWFTASPNMNKLDITLYVKGLTSENQEFIQNASFILLDTALGEYDVETKIGVIDWKAAPDTIPAKLQSFHELPNVVSRWTATRPS
ncbi:MAG TPA: hypothetical protein VGD58_03290 [Herpetosiphonaceae bacterium]